MIIRHFVVIFILFIDISCSFGHTRTLVYVLHYSSSSYLVDYWCLIGGRELLVGVGAERVHEGQVQSRRSGSRVPNQAAAAAAANLQATDSAKRLMTWASAAVSRSRSLKRKASTVRMVFAIHLTQWSTLRRRNGCRAWNNSTESNYAELQKFSIGSLPSSRS